MAIKATVITDLGETATLYIRLNNAQPSNHGVSTPALFRGFASRNAFQAGGRYLWEREIEFMANVSQPLWGQAYAALKALPEFAGAEDC